MIHAKRVCRQKKINVTEKLKLPVLLRSQVENIVRKGKNACYQHFLLFPPCFQKASFSKSRFFGKGLTLTKNQNFRMHNAERFCRRQIKYVS